MKRLRLLLSLIDWPIAVMGIFVAFALSGLVVMGVLAYREETARAKAGWHYHGECVEVDCSADVVDIHVPCTQWSCR